MLSELVPGDDCSMQAKADTAPPDRGTVTLVLGIAVDDPTSERAQNLTTCLTALRQQTLSREQYRIAIVEQGAEPRLETRVAPLVDDYVFAYSRRPFNRSWTLNIGAMRAAAGVICTFDADLIVPPTFLQRGLLAWQCGALAIKPFKGILYMDAESTHRVRRQIHAGVTIDCESSDHQGELHPWSKGGCIWIDARLYRELGGHDERFEGWGDEDREFWDRLTQRTTVVNLDGRLLHLYHARDFEQHPEVRANRVLWRARQHGLLPRPRSSAIGDPDRYRRNGAGHAETRSEMGSTATAERQNRWTRFRDAVLEDAASVRSGTPAWDGRQPRRLHVRGVLAARQGDDDIALACLIAAVRLDRTHADAFMDLGRLLLRRGQHADAIAAQLRALSLSRDDPEPYRELGLVLSRTRHHSAAVLAYQEALLLDLGDARTLGELGDALLAQGRLDRALAASEVVQRLEPQDPESYLRLGRVRLARGEWELARSAFKEGLARVEAPPETEPCRRRERSEDWIADERPPAVPAQFRSAGSERMVDARHVALHVGLGEAALGAGAPDAAADAFTAAAMLAPRDPHVLRRLVVAVEAAGRHDEIVGAWVALGMALDARHHLDEAAVAYQQALARKPDCLRAWLYLGRTRAARGELVDAVRCFEQALAVDPDHPAAHDGLGRAQYALGDVDAAWREFAWWSHPRRQLARGFDQPAWDGAAIEGRTILVWADQELGDTIHWIRYVPALKQLGARVVVECQSRLVSLVRTVPGIDLVVGQHAPLPQFDVHVPLTLVPVLRPACRTMACEAPYFEADAALVDYWRAQLGTSVDSKLTVGVCWAGHPEGINAAFRFAPLMTLASLAGVAGVRFVSLQMGPQTAELLGPPAGLHIDHLQDDSCSAADTGALMQSLDLVLTVDTMVAHLAGALGRPTWLVLPHMPDWRWVHKPNGSLPYPTMRLFRQERAGDWSGLFVQVRAALESEVKQRVDKCAGDADTKHSQSVEHSRSYGVAS